MMMAQYCAWLWFGWVIRRVLKMTGTFQLLLVHACTASRPLPFVMLPTSIEPGVQEKLGGAQPGQLTTGTFHTFLHHAQHTEVVDKEGDIWQYSPRIPKQPLPMVKLSFTKNG